MTSWTRTQWREGAGCRVRETRHANAKNKVSCLQNYFSRTQRRKLDDRFSSAKIEGNDSKPIRNTPEAPGTRSKYTNKFHNLTRTRSRSQIQSNNAEIMNRTSNRIMNFQIFQLLYFAPKCIKSIRNDFKILHTSHKWRNGAIPIFGIEIRPRYKKFNFRSDFLKIFYFPTFAKMRRIVLLTAKSKYEYTPKSEIIIRCYYHHQNFIPGSFAQKLTLLSTLSI